MTGQLPQPTSASAEPAPWKAVLGTAAGVFLGVVFVVGLYAKALDPGAFVETIRHEGLDFLLPAGVVAAVGLGIEAVLGFCLVLGLRHLRVLLPSAALVLFFVFLTARTYVAYDPNAALDESSCGCFGNLIERSPEEAFWQDLLLLVPACALAFLGRPKRAAPHTRARFVTALSLAAAVLVFAWFAPDLPLDDLATRLEPGVATGDLCAGEELPEPAAGDEVDDAPAAAGRVCVDDYIPELVQGEHLVVLADLAGAGLRAHFDALNAYALDTPNTPRLYVLAIATDDEVARYQLTQQPAFAVVGGHAGVLRPLFRRLPRSFLVRDGRVIRTWSDWPPLAEFAAAAAQDGPADPDDGR